MDQLLPEVVSIFTRIAEFHGLLEGTHRRTAGFALAAGDHEHGTAHNLVADTHLFAERAYERLTLANPNPADVLKDIVLEASRASQEANLATRISLRDTVNPDDIRSFPKRAANSADYIARRIDDISDEQVDADREAAWEAWVDSQRDPDEDAYRMDAMR